MIFYLHYILLTSGTCGTTVLLGVFIKTYSIATQGEIGFLIMSLPLVSLISKPVFCAMADRRLAHRSFLIGFLIFMLLGFGPLILIPFFPEFHQNQGRLSFFLLFLSSHLGNAGLNVAWSLGESLAINYAQKTGTAYSRMRLMGTISWGVYGYIIGLINEVPFLPKFVPAFLLLYLSVIIDIIMILLWNKEDFVMVDGSADMTNEMKKLEQVGETVKLQTAKHQALCESEKTDTPQVDSHKIAEQIPNSSNTKNTSGLSNKLTQQMNVEENTQTVKFDPSVTNEKTKNPQLKLLRMIIAEDGRVIKYFIVFVITGALISPINFVFLSYEDVCKLKGCNFSFLTGIVLMSQATAETIFFFVMPWILAKISKRQALTISFLVLAIRYYVYSQFFYLENFSPYWALLLESGHGISYSFVATILADVAYTTSNLSKLFIPELRKLKYLSATKDISQEQIEAEEYSVKLALRATMMALTNGLWEGLGYGIGNLLAGQLADRYSYTTVWTTLSSIAVVSLLVFQVVEYTNSRWSDTYKPAQGTKAYEILSFTRQSSNSGEKDTNKKTKKQEQQASDTTKVKLTSEV